MNPRLATWLVLRILSAAQWVMPAHRRRWISAMRAETSYLPSDGAVRWAAGCLVAAIQERIDTMTTGDLHISRFVMLVESIGCFGFLALAWFEITFGASGIVHHTPEVIERFYQSQPGGAFLVSMMFAGAVTGLVGLAGLFLGLRFAFTGRALASRAAAWVCIAALLGYMVLGGIAGYLFGPPDFRPNFDMALLLSILPAACIAHLHWLAYPRAPMRPALTAR